MVIKLTGLAFHELNQIAESLVPGNMAYFVAEENEKASNGIAFRCDCKGVTIGYLPELSTLRKYYRESKKEDERYRISAWGNAVKAVREQFKIDMDNNGQNRWSARVCGLLYADDAGWNSFPKMCYEFDEYSELCQKALADGVVLRQVSVDAESVEPF